MALKTSLRPLAKKIAEAVKKYAERQGFQTGDYALVGTWDERTDRISLVFGTNRQIDDRQWYSGIIQEIRKVFPRSPSITTNIGLVVEKVQSLDEVYYHFSGSEGETDLTEFLEQP